MSDWTTAGVYVVGSVVALILGRLALTSRPSSYPLPPGPPGIPWAGNVVGVNLSTPWTTYTQWGKIYGDVVYSRIFGKDVIILNSEKAAKDLLENRSKNYSDRPHLVTTELRIFHQTFKSDVVHRFLPYQHRKACQLLRRLFECPEELEDHVFEYTAGIIMNSAYSYDPASRKDELLSIVANVLTIIVPLVRPDIAVIIGAFPWLLCLPSWVPGMRFKKEMAIAREYSKQYLDRPFDYALQKPDNNVAASMIHDALREMRENGISPDQASLHALKEAAGSAFIAASETSAAVLVTFFLMMTVHPDVQEKIQAEIDAVVGRDRLPTIDDRPSLPFLDATFREIFRYSPTVPLSIPHAAADEDVYREFRIPKGAMVITNLWAMAHDETKFPDPHAFKPERFMSDDGSLKPNEVEHFAYGFGRRMCIGRHFADVSVWTVMAKTLAVFKILRPLDDNGMEIPVEAKFAGGNAVRPLPFKCRIVPRFPAMNVEKLEELIAASTT